MPTLLDRARAVLLRNRRAIRDALIVAGVLRAIVYFWVQNIRPWEFPGVDARAYWRVDTAHPYAESVPGAISAFLYSPAFAQAMALPSVLPFEAFFAIWTAILVVVLAWLVRPWPWALLILILPVVYELLVGQVHLFIAAVCVLGFRYPWLWAAPILMKITPGVALAWFAVRREWRNLAIAVGATVAVTAVSFALSPSAWFDWYAFLTSNSTRGELVVPRIALGAAISGFAGLTNRRWLIPVAVWISLPAVYLSAWVILLATIRLTRTSEPAAAADAAHRSSSPATQTA